MQKFKFLVVVLLSIHFVAKAQNARVSNADPRIPLPATAKKFPVGKRVEYFDLKDIYGNNISATDQKGKIVVLNFWFTACMPCRKEMPSLNELAYEFAKEPNVLFIAVALDKKAVVKDFLKSHPLAYTIIENGSYYADRYGVDTYPTNVVLNREGKVIFSEEGFENTTQYWIRKNLSNALKQ